MACYAANFTFTSTMKQAIVWPQEEKFRGPSANRPSFYQLNFTSRCGGGDISHNSLNKGDN
jgi:hypothetical protein